MTHADLDVRMMRLALQEARRARPSPNPPVGAVVVRGEEVVATAHHVRAGDPHAEELALAAAGEGGRGATLYVTLEPCNHFGRTSPCVDAILAAGVRRVVVGCQDPNPHVEGGGARRLGESGVEVTMGVEAAEARSLIAPWSKFVTTGIPHVALKLGLSLDGRIATRSGASKWVTGPEARARVQELRARRDAVAVGIGTVLSDDPRLTVRDTPGPSPVRVVFDTRLRMPLHTKLVTSAQEVPTWVITGHEAGADAERALVDHGVEVLRVMTSAEGRVDVSAALRALAAQGIVSVLVEGGAELAGSILATRTVDELHAFVAPILLGPRGRPGAVDWAGPDTPIEAPRIVEPRWELCGRDVYVSGLLTFPQRG